jgi:hypothetical protein
MEHASLGPCACEAIHFTCPRCEHCHSRGFLNGIDVFRCLHCGYVGHGFHPDPEIDRAVGQEMKAAIAYDKALGLAPASFWEGP